MGKITILKKLAIKSAPLKLSYVKFIDEFSSMVHKVKVTGEVSPTVYTVTVSLCKCHGQLVS